MIQFQNMLAQADIVPRYAMLRNCYGTCYELQQGSFRINNVITLIYSTTRVYHIGITISFE